MSLSTSNSTHTSPGHSRAPSSIPMRGSQLQGLDHSLDQLNLNVNSSGSSNLNAVSTASSNNSSNASLLQLVDNSHSVPNSTASEPSRPLSATESFSNQPRPPQQDPNESISYGSPSEPLVPVSHFSNPNLRSDLILLISQWLQDEGFGATRLMLLDEANVKSREREELKADNKKLRKALMEGDFIEIDKLLSKGTSASGGGGNKLVKHEKAFKYSVYKQQYLELIEQREFQKAFTFLNKRLKPLEHYQPNSTEFQNLCYLLTSKSVTDAPQFRNWEGIQPAREKLVEEYDRLISMERAEKEGGIPTTFSNDPNNPNISSSTTSAASSSIMGGMRGIGSGDPNDGDRTSSEDHLHQHHSDSNGNAKSQDGNGSGGRGSDPNRLDNNTSKNNLLHHQRELNGGNYVPPHRLITLLSQSLTHQIKSAKYKAQKTPLIDTLMWDWRATVVPNFLERTLRGHRRNVKCLAFVGESGDYIVSGSSDNTVRIWSTTNHNQRRPIHTQVPASTSSTTNPITSTASSSCISVLSGHASRIWSVDSTRSGSLICSGSGDGTVRLWKTSGQSQSASILTPNSNGSGYGVSNNSFVNSNGISGSYLDSIRSGDIYACKFLPNENQVVAGGYDRIIRMFDVNTSSVVRTFTGHQGAITSLSINPNGTLMASASKDSTIKIWDTISGNVKTIETHLGEVSSISINESVSGSEDGLLYLFNIETGEQIQTLKGHGFKSSKSITEAGITTSTLESEITNTSGNNTAYEAVWNRNKNLLASCGDDASIRTWTHQ